MKPSPVHTPALWAAPRMVREPQASVACQMRKTPEKAGIRWGWGHLLVLGAFNPADTPAAWLRSAVVHAARGTATRPAATGSKGAHHRRSGHATGLAWRRPKDAGCSSLPVMAVSTLDLQVCPQNAMQPCQALPPRRIRNCPAASAA